MSRRLAVLAATLVLTLGLAAPASAADDRDSTAITGWWQLSYASLTDVNNRVTAGYRLIDIEVVQASPLRFAATFVANTGSYAKSWWWYYGQTSSELLAKASANGARLIDVEAYSTTSGTRYVGAMVKKTGADNKAWWWWTGSSTFIASKVSELNARIIDLDRTPSGLITAVMIRNTGSDAKSWWYYYSRTAAQVTALLSSNNARLIDIERTSTGNFDVVMYRKSGEAWWWYYGYSGQELLDKANQNGARVIDIERYGSLYAGVLLENASSETRRVNELMRSAVSGSGFWGQHLKRVGSGTISSINATRVFEPASMIKGIFAVKTINDYEESSLKDLIDLDTDEVTWYTGQSGSCPTGTGATTDTVTTVLMSMLQPSDNRATNAIVTNFGGRAGMNSFADAIGSPNISTNHLIGCGSGPDGAVENPNTMTLVDSGNLYERASNGTLLGAAAFAKLRSVMLSGDNGTGLLSRVLGIIQGRAASGANESVASEATAVGLSAADRIAFRNRVKMSWKAGSYGLDAPGPPGLYYHWTMGGWISIPFQNTTSGAVTDRKYVFGWYTNESSTNAGAQLAWDRGAEVLRQLIHDAMVTWKAAPPPPP